jgi:anti-sigma B factor antagonist
VVVVTGEADAQAESELRRAISEVSADGRPSVVIDLLGATLIDSRAIGVLAEWAQRLTGSGRTLALVCTDPNILRVLRITGLEHLFQLAESRSDVQV